MLLCSKSSLRLSIESVSLPSIHQRCEFPRADAAQHHDFARNGTYWALSSQHRRVEKLWPSVQRVFPRQSNEVRISWNPMVRAEWVCLVDGHGVLVNSHWGDCMTVILLESLYVVLVVLKTA